MLDNLISDFNRIPYLKSHTPDIPYLSFPFFLEMVGYLCANEGYCLEQEGFEQYFFGLTLSGSGSLELKGGNYVLTPNQAFLLDRREYFKIGTVKDGKWNFKWFYFGGAACKEYFQLINGKSFQPVLLTNAAETGGLVDELNILAQKQEPMVDLDISILISRILTSVIRSKHLNIPITRGKSEILEKSMDYILKNYDSNLKIDDICNAVFTTKSHLINLFRTYLHTTPHKYITKLKIDESKKLLSETNYTVSDISQMIGFETTGVFIENFRKYTGLTPNKYRKAIIFPTVDHSLC